MSWRCTRGTVFAEFIIAFPVIFVLFLAIVQLSLIGAASLVVRHAAYRAAREASLVIDEDPKHVQESPRGVLRVGGDGASSHGPRMERIESAALGALRAIAPPPSAITAWVEGETPALDEGAFSSGWARAAAGLLYTREATEWSVAPGSGIGGLKYLHGQPALPLRLTYHHVCAVPVANALICNASFGLRGAGALQQALGVELPHVIALEASAQVVVHRANYLYRSEHDDG